MPSSSLLVNICQRAENHCLQQGPFWVLAGGNGVTERRVQMMIARTAAIDEAMPELREAVAAFVDQAEREGPGLRVLESSGAVSPP